MIESGVKAPRPVRHAKPALGMPDDFDTALTANAAARAAYDAFPPGAQRDYLEWITSAKRAETRAGRIAQAVVWIAEGKRRNWKYETC